MKLVNISSQGQFTLPKEVRDNIPYKQFVIYTKGKNIILKPVEVKFIDEKDELKDFGALSAKSFEFWNNEDDDIYEQFYNEKQSTKN